MPENKSLRIDTCQLLGYPKRIEIELSSSCNLQCVYCPRRFFNNLNGFLDLGAFKKIVDESAVYPETVIVLHRRGESLLHPNFIEICEYIRGKFKEIQLATNATLLDEGKNRAIIDSIHFISFSIDVPSVFNKTRIPAKYSDVQKRILHFLDMNGGRVKTQVSMVKTEITPNENLQIFKKLWRKKVDRVRIYEEHSKDGRFGSLKCNRGRRLPCVMPFYELLICSDGKVRRCNHDWDGFAMGDVNKNSLKEIWNSSIYAELRKQHSCMNIYDEVCRNCDSWYAEIGNQGTGETIK
ncbi:MAG: radical SAM protein [Candidatus Omnitrophica bacterium]|nr:radical SAM protein [Candidatus Omnitrophota bacterium]